MYFKGKPELLRLYHAGDERVLREVYALYGDTVYGYCHDRVAGAADARDLTEEVFRVAFGESTRRRFEGVHSYQWFLLELARRMLVLRRAGADASADLFAEELAEAPEPPEITRPLEEIAVRERLLRSFLDGLGEFERAFFHNHLVMRPSRDTTAGRFGITEAQVRKTERRLRRELLEHLKANGYLDNKSRLPPSRRVTPVSVRSER